MTRGRQGVERHGGVSRSRTHGHGWLPRRWRRALSMAALCGVLLAPPSAMPATAAESGAHASTAGTSRWWKLTCDKAGRKRTTETAGCAFTVQLRGVLDGSRRFLVRQALQRHNAAWRSLQRAVAFHIDVDSPGGELFATLEMGRLLYSELGFLLLTVTLLSLLVPLGTIFLVRKSPLRSC